jgi:integrase
VGADAELGFDTVDGVRIRMHSVLAEALDNDYIPKNPCHRIETPDCKAKGESRSLTEDEVRALWDGTDGRDYLFWRLLILTGPRISEIFPLERPHPHSRWPDDRRGHAGKDQAGRFA